MNIKNLKAKIENLPDNMQVFIEQVNTEFEYSLVAYAEVENIKFTGEKEVPKDDVFVLSDI